MRRATCGPGGGVLDRIREGSKVAMIRLRSLGDCVLTTPAIELLKGYRPDLRIGVVVEERFAGVFEGNLLVSTILGPEYGQMLGWHPALSLNLHGGTRSMLLTLASQARHRAGFAHHLGSAIYTEKIPRAQEILAVDRTVHTAEHLASAMFYLGVPVGEVPRARLYAKPRPAARPYAVIHATAAAAYKTWHPEGFLAAAGYLERDRNLEPVFIGAGGDDLDAFSRYRVVRGAPLSEVKSLLASASFFLGNDSGPAHMAAAFGIPLVVLFGRLEHQVIWAPWRAGAARTLASPDGISGIKTDEVIAAMEELR